VSEIPRAVASGDAGAAIPSDRVEPRRTAIAMGVAVAVFLFALYSVWAVPARAIELIGGAGSGVARHGGIVATSKSGERIEMPGVSQANAAESIALLVGGGVQFREVIESTAAAELVTLGIVGEHGDPHMDVDSWQPDGGGERHKDYYLVGHDRARLEATFAEATRRGWQPPPNTAILYERVEPSSWRSYFVSKTVEVDGSAIENATGAYDPNTSRPTVLVEFGRAGAHAFGSLTERIVGHKLATVLAGVVRSAPVINEPIRGGRAVITMGSTATAEHDRDVLVETLRTGSLPLDGTMTDAHWVPASNGPRESIARVLIALAGGLVAAALAWLLVGVMRPERCVIAPIAGPRTISIWRRVAWTLGAIAVFLVGSWFVVPGINEPELAHMIAYGGGSAHELVRVSVFGLGVGPLITSFVIVELVASIVPRWRPLRDTVLGRRRLGLATAIVACVVATVQAFFFVRYVAALPNDVELVNGFGLAFATLAAGPLCLAVLASVIGSRGLGSGYGVLIVVGWLRDARWSTLSSSSLALTGAAIVATTVIVLGVLRWRVRAPGGAAVPLPAAGIVPLHAGGGVIAIVVLLPALGIRGLPAWVYDAMHTVEGLVAGAISLVIATVVWAWVFARPGRRRTELAAASRAPTSGGAWLRAVALSVVALLALFAIAAAAGSKLADPIGVAIAAAVIADLVAEWRDRRRAQLVAVWPLHDPLLVEPTRDRLVAAGIPHHVQSTRFRTLLWLLGPYVPMMVLVPTEHAEAAYALLSSP
jgi:hypothetical protein